MSDVLGDGPGQKRDRPAVEAGLDALLQIARQVLLVFRDVFLATVGAVIGCHFVLLRRVHWAAQQSEPTNAAESASAGGLLAD